MRNVQTQHGDYRTVDEENIVLVQKCLWIEEPSTVEENEGETSASIAAEPEQVVWIEPFSEVSSVR